jgi:hypothetical protein
MSALTWVEILLMGMFVGTLAFSVGFCISNYAKDEKDLSDL